MAEGCSSYPTLTRTDEVRTESVFTTFTYSTTTVPSSLSSYTTTSSCSVGTCVAAPTVVTTEIPGYTSTVQVPVTLTSFIDTTTVTTLWASTCTNSDPSSRSVSRSASRTQSPSVVETTSIAISTRPDGRVTSSVVTVTATPLNQATGGSKKTNIAPIAGGAAGGLVALIIILLAAWYCLKRRATKAELDNLFDKAHPAVDLHDHDPDPEKAGYSQQQQTQDIQQKIQNLPSQPQQQQRQAMEYQPQQPSPPLQQSPDISRHDVQPAYQPAQVIQPGVNDARDEKQRLKQAYEEMDRLAAQGAVATESASIGDAYNVAGPSHYQNQPTAGPSTAAIPPRGGYYNPTVTNQLPPEAVQYPGSGVPVAPVPGPSGYGYYPTGQVGYAPAPANPRMSQYVEAPVASRPTSAVKSHQSGYYQPSPPGTAHFSPVQPQVPLSPVPGPSAGVVHAPVEPPRSEKQRLVHLDGTQYVDGVGSSGAAPPPAYTERG